MRRGPRITHGPAEAGAWFALGVGAVLVGWFGGQWIDDQLVAAAPAAARAPAPLAPVAEPAAPVAEPVAVRMPAIPVAAPPVGAPPAAAPAVPPPGDRIGTFRLTRYYVADEAGFTPAAVHASTSGAAAVTIYDDRGCRPIAELGKRFAEVLDVQGTGRLRDGRVVNVSKLGCGCPRAPCYRTMGASARWGMSATSRPLQPFRTVAVDPDVVALGTTLYIAELDGLTMPGQAPWGGFIHDGCVIAADVGGGVDGHHVDLFVGRSQYKAALDRRRPLKRVTVHRGAGRCDQARGHVARDTGI
jgi:3D (Asp-Asp-Asp) domain-containing protein